MKNTRSSGQQDKGHALAWLFGALAALLFAFAQLPGLDRAPAIWMKSAAGVSTALALWREPKVAIPHKRFAALVFMAFCLGVGFLFQVFLKSGPVKIPIQTGSASSTGNASPAVSGSGNMIGYGASEPAQWKASGNDKKLATDSQSAGSASSIGDLSPAVSGSGNSVSYGSAEPAREKKASHR